jgi:enoyl-CoA hydratase/carnithine racemase
MEYREITLDLQAPVSVLTLNSPKTINSLSKNMIAEITGALKQVGASEAKVLILKANGKHFCSGHNLGEMVNCETSEAKALFDRCSDMMLTIHKIPQIVIAQVHGVATAAGCQIVATCDLAVADETARFGTPGVRIGLFCTTPMLPLSRSIGRKKALEMLMTGRLISADEAEKCGLINKITPEAELDKTVLDMASQIAEASPLVLGIGKQAFYNQIELDEGKAYEYASNVMALNLMADDAQIGIQSFLDKKKPVWTGK